MKYFGLDYGTTNSLLYGYDEGDLVEICNTPSAVIVANGKVTKWGEDAFNDPDRAFQSYVESPKRSINNLDGSLNGVSYRSMIEKLLGNMTGKIEPGSHITLTVPNSYTAPNYIDMHNILTQCLNDALGGNHNIQIHLLPEPVAAALFYVHKHYSELPTVCHLVVCDIGGGTTDLCIIELRKTNRKLSFRVTEGMQHADIGGNDFDKAISRTIIFPASLSSQKKRNLIYQIKSKLSENECFNGHSISLNRTAFETCISTYTARLENLMRQMLEASGLEVDDSWYLLPVGGSSQIPVIRDLLQEVFPEAHQTYKQEKTIFNSVAQGAAIYSAWRGRGLSINQYDEIHVEHHTPHEIQFKTAYGSWHTIVPQNAKDGRYPEGNKDNIELCCPDNIKIMNDKYTIGEIVLREADSIWSRTHSIPFSLGNREIKDIKLQLGIEIENCRIKEWWLKDTLTGETEPWSIEP